MNRFVSIIVVFVILSLIAQGLDARKGDSSLNNNKKQLERHRNKRQFAPIFPTYSTNSLGACDYSALHTCDAYAYGITQSGTQLQRTISYVKQRKLFVGGLVSLSALQNGGMCIPNTNLFTANAFAAIELGHITLPQLATLNLFPVQTIDTNILLNAGYLSTYGQANLLTALGLQASIFGHIVPSQLQALSLYPLQATTMTAETLIQAGYLTSDCIPTALGISALHIRYLPRNNLAAFGCQFADYSQVSMTNLIEAKYIYGASNILTPVGLAAMRTGFFSRETYQRLGIFPFGASIQAQSTEYVYQEQQRSTIINDLVHVGYLHPHNYLITGAGYYALTKDYFTIEHFRTLSLWPFTGTPSMNMFIAAGYTTYSGHLTALGYSLLHAQYFPSDWLPRLGIHIHDDFHIFHHALRYGGYFRSDYHIAHTAIHSASVSTNVEAAQVAAYRTGAAVGVAGSLESGSVVYAKK